MRSLPSSAKRGHSRQHDPVADYWPALRGPSHVALMVMLALPPGMSSPSEVTVMV